MCSELEACQNIFGFQIADRFVDIALRWNARTELSFLFSLRSNIAPLEQRGLRKLSKAEWRLTPIVPVVFYTGTGAWKSPFSLFVSSRKRIHRIRRS